MKPHALLSQGHRPLAEPDIIGAELSLAAGQELGRQLHWHLAALRFPAFADLAQLVLARSGYHKVVLAGRLSPRGRILHGGCDLQAYTHTDLETVVTAVQLKQYHCLVGRRFVDELRGAMLRLGAEQGLLITTSAFSPAVRQVARESDIAPVRLVDGAEFISILLQHRLGICQRDGQWQVDHAFFKRLGRRAAASSRDGASQSLVAVERTLTRTTDNPGPAKAPGLKKGGGMTWPTHMMVGLNTLWFLDLFATSATPVNIELLAAVAVFGALLPDLDASQSKIKHLGLRGIKPFFTPSRLLQRWLGHRGLLHSLLGLCFIGVLVVPLGLWWSWSIALALWLGYASHLAADACTRSGIPMLFPRKQRYHLLPAPLRVLTGSPAEDLLFVLDGCAAILLLLHHVGAVTPGV